MLRRRNDSWQVRVYAGIDPTSGKQRHLYRTVHGTKRDARDVERELEKEALNGAGQRAARTVDELLDAWLDVARLEASTRYQTGHALDRHVRPRIGPLPLGRLKPVALDQLYRDLERGIDGRPALAGSTVARIHGALHAALEQAVRWEWLTTNPASRARPPAQGAPDPRPPAPDVVAKLLIAAVERDVELATFLRVAAATGMRRGEVCALRWAAVDLDAGTVQVARALGQGRGAAYEKAIKAGRPHRIALDPGTVDVLRAQRRASVEAALACGAARDDGSYIFSPAPDGARPWRPQTFTKRFKRLRDAVGAGDVQLRALRHFAATQLLDAGFAAKIVSGRLGHDRTSTTQDIYAAWVPASDQLAAEYLGRIIDGQA